MKSVLCLGLVFVLVACGDDSATAGSDASVSGDASVTGSKDSAVDAGGDPAMSGPCNLIDDTGGPGQYADNCVKREWVEEYAGTYASDMCELEIDVSGAVPAVFTLEVKSGDLAGTYAYDWEGGSGMGNDSYYRFTTDATFETTATLSFAAAEKVSDNEEASIGFRVENLTTTPTFTANLQITITTPFKNDLVECGALTKQ